MKYIISESQSELIRIMRRINVIDDLVKKSLYIVDSIWDVSKEKYPTVEDFTETVMALILSKFYLEDKLKDLDEYTFEKFVEKHYTDDIIKLYNKKI